MRHDLSGGSGPLQPAAQPYLRALHIGFTQDQIIEVFMHLMLYDGVPFAREAMDVAKDIFINGSPARHGAA